MTVRGSYQVSSEVRMNYDCSEMHEHGHDRADGRCRHSSVQLHLVADCCITDEGAAVRSWQAADETKREVPKVLRIETI